MEILGKSKTKDLSNELSKIRLETMVVQDTNGKRKPVDQQIDQPLIRKLPHWQKMRTHIKECVFKFRIKASPELLAQFQAADKETQENILEEKMPPLFRQKRRKYDQREAKKADGSIDHTYYKKKKKEEERRLMEQEIREKIMREQVMQERQKQQCLQLYGVESIWERKKSD